MKLTTLFVIVLISIPVSAQETNGIQFIATPHIQELGNLNNRYTIIDCETIFSKHKKLPAYEFGALYHHNFNGNWGWGIGLTWKNARYESQIEFSVYEQPDKVQFEYYNFTSVNYSNLKLQTSYRIHDRIQLNAVLNLEFPRGENVTTQYGLDVGFGVTNHLLTPSGTQSTPVQHNDIDIDRYRYDLQGNIVPEFNVHFEAYKGLNLFLGFRFKFWKSKYPLLRTEVFGFTGYENYSNQGTIYLSEVDNREYSIFLGLMYEIKWLKKDKNNVHNTR